MTKRFRAFPLNSVITFIPDFNERVKLLNTIFAEQYSLSKNNSEIPSNLKVLTENCLSNIQISNVDVIKIINNLTSNKAHGKDMINIRNDEIMRSPLYKSLSVIFKPFLSQMKFPIENKRANVIPSYKKIITSTLETTNL